MTTEHDEGFAAGDRVRVVRRVDKQEGWADTWVLAMDDCIGRQGVVEQVDDYGINVTIDDGEGRWNFPPAALKRINAALKPAPRSAEHTRIETDDDRRLQEQEQALRQIDTAIGNDRLSGDPQETVSGVLDCLAGYQRSIKALETALATAPSTRIEAEPVACQYAQDVAMPEYRCVGKCQYDRTPDARSTSDAASAETIIAAYLEHYSLPGTAAYHHLRDCIEAALADRATRSTDSSAEAAGMERAARWVDDRADAYDRDHGTTDPDTGTRGWPGDGEDYLFELDEIATGIRAEAAKLTTAPHTADETRVDGGAT